MAKKAEAAQETVSTPLDQKTLKNCVVYLHNMAKAAHGTAEEHNAALQSAKILLTFIEGVDIDGGVVSAAEETPAEPVAETPAAPATASRQERRAAARKSVKKKGQK